MKFYFIIAFGLIGLASCTKVIDINLNSSNPQYVIEGNVTNGEGAQTVHITRSVNYSDESKYPAVTNAIVILSDGTGNTDTLSQEVPGYYSTARIAGVPGHTYDMHIIVDGHEFSSSSTMPPLVAFDSLHLINESSFGKEIISPVVTFQDPSGMRNFYHFTIYNNESRLKTIYIDNDLVNDGHLVNTSLRDFDVTYKSGDKLRIEMQCIPSQLFDYYYSLQETIAQSSATPANPITNIKGDNVLGYFSAHTVYCRELIVP